MRHVDSYPHCQASRRRDETVSRLTSQSAAEQRSIKGVQWRRGDTVQVRSMRLLLLAALAVATLLPAAQAVSLDSGMSPPAAAPAADRLCRNLRKLETLAWDERKELPIGNSSRNRNWNSRLAGMYPFYLCNYILTRAVRNCARRLNNFDEYFDLLISKSSSLCLFATRSKKCLQTIILINSFPFFLCFVWNFYCHCHSFTSFVILIFESHFTNGLKNRKILLIYS